MKKIIAQEQLDWVASAFNWLDEKQKHYQAKSLYVPAGETPKLIYNDWEARQPDLVKKMKMIQIDDVHTGAQKDVFKRFFHDFLPSFADRIEYFEQGQTQADLGILGLGMNGHVAFHEPGLPANFYSGCVRLQEETIHNLHLEKITWGKTYGAGAFNRCKALLMIVKGEKKKAILEKTLKNNSEIPASALLRHPDLTILTDFEF